MQFFSYLHACRNQVFLIFENILRTTKNFRNRRNFFQVLLSTIFYKSSSTFNETFLTSSLLAYNIFSKKNSCFLFLDKSQVRKSVDVITGFSCTVKKQKFNSIQAHSWTPSPFPTLSFSKCLVCFFVYLHHFYKYYLCFTGRI